MKNPLSRELFNWLDWYRRDACADDEALYVQRGNQYFKLVPTVVHATEYNEAWDRARNLIEVKKMKHDVKHTKGPWRVRMVPLEQADGAYSINQGGEDCGTEFDHTPMLDEVDGNCALIAAAPGMLEALKQIRLIGDRYSVDALDALIAKAEGEK